MFACSDWLRLAYHLGDLGGRCPWMDAQVVVVETVETFLGAQ